jgi:hypothetical protein
MQRNEVYNYTFLTREFANYMYPNAEDNILFTWTYMVDDPPFWQLVLNDYTGIYEMIPKDYDWEWDIDEDYYGPYAKIRMAYPPYPDQWWPDHSGGGAGGGAGASGTGDGDSGTGGGLGGNLMGPSDSDDPMEEIIGVGKSFSLHVPSSQYEILQINGLDVRINGLPIFWPNGE